MQSSVKILSDEGKGRTFLVLIEKDSELQVEMKKLTETLQEKSRIVLCEVDKVSSENWDRVCSDLDKAKTEVKLRHYSIVGFEGAGNLAQNLYLANANSVRSMILVNSSSRPAPSNFDKIMQKIEKTLPMGLPFRKRSAEFDSKSYLQRMRCPVLVACTAKASEYVNKQYDILLDGLPTSWGVKINKNLDEFSSIVKDFESVPAKCPQRKR